MFAGTGWAGVDWGAVEAIATAAAVVLAAIGGWLAYRTWRDAAATMKSQQQMLGIEQQRWAEERHEYLAAARRTAALLTISITHVPRDEGGLVMRVKNEADVPFEDIIIEADPDHPQANEGAANFGYLISALRPGEEHDRSIRLPTGLWWRVRYLDIGGRKWAQTPVTEFPYRLG